MSDSKRALTMSFSGQRKPVIGKPRPMRPSWKKQLFPWAKREKLRAVAADQRPATPAA
jgi:hypothetical protein